MLHPPPPKKNLSIMDYGLNLSIVPDIGSRWNQLWGDGLRPTAYQPNQVGAY